MRDLDKIESTGEIPPHVDVLHISNEERETIRTLEDKALKTGTGQIIKYIQDTDPEYFEREKESVLKKAKLIPALGFTSRKEGDRVILNTDLVKDPDIEKIYLRHESVETVMRHKNLDALDVAIQIGIDPAEIIFDDLDTPQHYVALYHQAKLARDMGKTEKMLEELKKTAGKIVGTDILDFAKKEEVADGTTWQQRFKETGKEHVNKNLKIMQTIVENQKK